MNLLIMYIILLIYYYDINTFQYLMVPYLSLELHVYACNKYLMTFIYIDYNIITTIVFHRKFRNVSENTNVKVSPWRMCNHFPEICVRLYIHVRV